MAARPRKSCTARAHSTSLCTHPGKQRLEVKIGGSSPGCLHRSGRLNLWNIQPARPLAQLSWVECQGNAGRSRRSAESTAGVCPSPRKIGSVGRAGWAFGPRYSPGTPSCTGLPKWNARPGCCLARHSNLALGRDPELRIPAPLGKVGCPEQCGRRWLHANMAIKSGCTPHFGLRLKRGPSWSNLVQVGPSWSKLVQRGPTWSASPSHIHPLPPRLTRLSHGFS